jgi:hypothetical protein
LVIGPKKRRTTSIIATISEQASFFVKIEKYKKSDLLEEDEFPPKRDVPLFELVFPPPNEKLLDDELLLPPNIPEGTFRADFYENYSPEFELF